jgi:F0F1-type ATP synthase assembly protein I
MESNNSNNKGKSSAYAKYSSLAIQMVLTIGGAIYLGLLLDNHLELKFPLFMILFMLLATGGVFYTLYKSIQNDDTNK